MAKKVVMIVQTLPGTYADQYGRRHECAVRGDCLTVELKEVIPPMRDVDGGYSVYVDYKGREYRHYAGTKFVRKQLAKNGDKAVMVWEDEERYQKLSDKGCLGYPPLVNPDERSVEITTT